MRVDFLATEAERAANPKVLSSFNGLFLETTERMTNAQAYANAGVRIILDFIFQILAGGNQEYNSYIIGWFASGLQKLRKTGVILCFIGAAGVGKSLLFSECDENHPIFQTIYGGVDGHYMIG